MKVCSKCKEEKPLESFSLNKSTGYRQSWCNTCKSSEERRRRADKGIPKRKKLVVTLTHKQCNNCLSHIPHKGYYKSAKGTAGRSSYCKGCTKAKYYNKEKSREATIKYRVKNKERWNALHRIHQFNRKSKIKATSDGSLTDEVLKRILSESTCFWCRKQIQEEDRTIEHIVELSNGGNHSVGNCTMSCLSCNSSRPNKSGNYDHLGEKVI